MADTLDRQEQLRRDLVADVAHELRTPVAILQAGHEALLDGVVDATPDQLTSLRDEVLRLARMVDDLQTLAAADAATLQLTLRRCDLAEVTAGGRRTAWPGGSRRPTSSVERQAGPGLDHGRPALAAPGDHEPAHQRAEVHPAGGQVGSRGRGKRPAQ